MHDVILIQALEGIDELLEDEQGLLFGDDSLPQLALQGASVAILVHEIEVVGSLEHVDVLYDVLVLFDVRQDVDLVDRALLQLLVLFEPSNLDYLHCVLLVVQLVYCSKHLTVCAFSDYLIQSVVLDYSNHHYYKNYKGTIEAKPNSTNKITVTRES